MTHLHYFAALHIQTTIFNFLELYDVSVQVRNTASKTKLDVYCNKFSVIIALPVAERLKS